LDLEVPISGLGPLPSEQEAARVGEVIGGGDSSDGNSDGEDEDEFEPELRLLESDNPAAYNYTSQYAAHKVPRDIVDATMAGNGGGLMEFAQMWRQIQDAEQR
jgi:hypothetical protein